MRAYIVEDSELFRNRLVLLLEEIDGLEIVGLSGSIKAATENIFRLQPDVMLVDISLPDGSGLDLLAKTQACGLKIIPIVMTLDPYPEHRKLATERGAVCFFDKAKELWKIPAALVQMIAQQQAAVERARPSHSGLAKSTLHS